MAELDVSLSSARRIWVIRHGDRFDFDVGKESWEKDFAGTNLNDPVLSDLGRLQAIESAEEIRKFYDSDRGSPLHISRVITSPFVRCIETSHPVASLFSTSLCIDNSLFEVVYTTEEHPSPADRRQYFPRVDLAYESEPRPAADEAFPEEALERYGRAAVALAAKFVDEDIFICSHAAGVSAIIARLLEVRVRDLPPIVPAAIFCLERIDDATDVRYKLHPDYIGKISQFSKAPGKTLAWPREEDNTDTWGMKWIASGDEASWVKG